MRKQYDKYYVAKKYSYDKDFVPPHNVTSNTGSKRSYDLWASSNCNPCETYETIEESNCETLCAPLEQEYNYPSPYPLTSYLNHTSDYYCDNLKNNFCNNSLECSIPSNCFDDNCSCNHLLNYKCGRYYTKAYKGNIGEFTFEQNDCEIRLDLSVKKIDSVVIWGEVRNQCEEPCSDILVTLLKPAIIRGKLEYLNEGCTLTNNIGYYQFHIDFKDKDKDYKILLSQKCR